MSGALYITCTITKETNTFTKIKWNKMILNKRERKKRKKIKLTNLCITTDFYFPTVLFSK
jgi:hypothetical protein